MSWQNKLMEWYDLYKREFPWRQTKDPYKIWLSEIIMQQTRTQQGLPYYEAFVSTFPTVADLAAADEGQVLKLWQGLGYYSRARNLHSTAKEIYYTYDSKFPTTFKGLLALKGVGDYTASAIASIAYDLPEAVVDGNVYRVYARFFGIDLPVPSSVAFKHFKALAQKVLPTQSPGNFNQAVMELGALQCVPKNPNCTVCPLASSCKAFAWGQVAQYPVKAKKAKIRYRYFNYLIFQTPDHLWYLKQRKESGIWHKLFEFPLVETQESIQSNHKLLEKAIADYTTGGSKPVRWKQPLLHKLTHQQIEINFWFVQACEVQCKGYSKKELDGLAVPVPIANFIKETRV